MGGHHENLGAIGFRPRSREVPDHLQPGSIGHAVVDDQEIEVAPVDEALCLSRASRRDDLVALFAERPAERPEDLLLIVDQENPAGRGRIAHVLSEALGGRSSIRTRVPREGSLSTSSRPPRDSTMFLLIARPRPVPVRLVVK